MFCEDAKILSHDAFAGEQWIVRVHAPKCANAAQPGQFAHITCHPMQPMRRPISIMRANPAQGWVDFLYKVVGTGTQHLSERTVGENLNLIAPIGTPFQLHANTKHHVLIGGGVGMPPMIHLAETLYHQKRTQQALVLLGSEVPFPFRPQPSKFLLPNWPEGVIAAMPLFEDWGIVSRLASLQTFPGCFQGYITALAAHWLDSLSPEEKSATTLYACGPTPMLQAVAQLSARYQIPAQLSLEEYMACAVGGCAGCTVPITTQGQVSMKRVCVDGPIFSADSVYPELFLTDP